MREELKNKLMSRLVCQCIILKISLKIIQIILAEFFHKFKVHNILLVIEYNNKIILKKWVIQQLAKTNQRNKLKIKG
jgi:hypothetical protein